ncbi:MAG: hypothetical protein MPJ25_04430, partial [Pirellulales bacterium]|nr:hypothetical protein [Pirellulales bacterium]
MAKTCGVKFVKIGEKNVPIGLSAEAVSEFQKVLRNTGHEDLATTESHKPVADYVSEPTWRNYVQGLFTKPVRDVRKADIKLSKEDLANAGGLVNTLITHLNLKNPPGDSATALNVIRRNIIDADELTLDELKSTVSLVESQIAKGYVLNDYYKAKSEVTNDEETNTKRKIREIKDIFNFKGTIIRNNSKYSVSKIDKEARDKINAIKKAFITSQKDYNYSDLVKIHAALDNIVAVGLKNQQEALYDIATNRADIKETAADAIKNIDDVDPATLNVNDIKVLAKEKASFVERLKKRGILGVLADFLSPASNDDFRGLLYRVFPRKGPKRAETRENIQKILIDPLNQANYDIDNYSTALDLGVEGLKKKYKIKPRYLRRKSNINVGKNNLTNSQVVMVYNWIKDANSHNQLIGAGITYAKMNEIADYVDSNSNLKGYADEYVNVYRPFEGLSDNVLVRHGNPGIQKATMPTELTDEQKKVLNKVYNGNIPYEIPYIPFLAEGRKDILDITDDNLSNDKEGFYSVMTGRVKTRNYKGVAKFAGYDLNSLEDDYKRTVLHSISYLDFAKNATAFFSYKNMNALEASLGTTWAAAMRDSLKRIVTGRITKPKIQIGTYRLDKWLNRTIGGIMFVNPRSAMLQMVSVTNFALDDPFGYVKYSTYANENYQSLKEIWASPFSKQRGTGKTDVVSQVLFEQKGDTNIGNFIDEVGRRGYFLTRGADRLAIALGGAPYLTMQKNKLAKANPTWSKEKVNAEAMKKFVEKADEAQQSTRADRLGHFQTTGLGRYLLQFTNALQQFNRIVSRSLRDIQAGENVSNNLYKVSSILGIQIAGFAYLQQAMANAYDDDEEDEKKWER